MFEFKKKHLIILIIIIALIALICLHRSVLPAPHYDTDINVWYVADDSLWCNFISFVREYNLGEGAEYGISVRAKSFPSEAELYNEISSAIGSEDVLPDIVVCSTDFAAYLSSAGILADMDSLLGRADTSHFDSGLLSASTLDEKLISVPLAASCPIFIANTELYDVSVPLTFEELCELSGEYYSSCSCSYFTISDYSVFFRTAAAQLGTVFDGVKPHDSDNEICKQIYNVLAEAAYNRGYGHIDKGAVKLVANGSLPCAVVDSSEVMKYLSDTASDDICFPDYPVMSGGKAVAVYSVTGLSILSSSEDNMRASALFASWFSSDEVNTRFVKGSGCKSVNGLYPDSDGEIYSKLRAALLRTDEADQLIYPPDSQYRISSFGFNTTLTNVMNSFS